MELRNTSKINFYKFECIIIYHKPMIYMMQQVRISLIQMKR